MSTDPITTPQSMYISLIGFVGELQYGCQTQYRALCVVRFHIEWKAIYSKPPPRQKIDSSSHAAQLSINKRLD